MKKNIKKESVDEEREDKKMSKELIWIFSVMVGLIAIILLVYAVKDSVNRFTFEGMTFTKEIYGNRDNGIPVYHYYYFYNDLEGNTYKYNLYLRNDPRENNISSDAGIEFPLGKDIYLSIDVVALSKCSDSSLAVQSLAAFLSNNLLRVKSAVPDKNLSIEMNATYATCETHPENVVIILQEGNQTVIRKDDSCHTITVDKCEDLILAVERFQIQALMDRNKRLSLD